MPWSLHRGISFKILILRRKACWHGVCDLLFEYGHGYGHGRAAPDRSWRKCNGSLWRTHHVRRRSSCSVLCARKHLRKHRELANDRLQAHRYELPRSHSRYRHQQPARRQRRNQLARDQHRAGRRSEGGCFDLHGNQRRRLLRGAEARQLHRQQSCLQRREQLYPPRRLHARQERLSCERRRLLSRRHSDRSDHRQRHRQQPAGAEIRQRLPARAADLDCHLSRQPRVVSADDEERQIRSRL